LLNLIDYPLSPLRGIKMGSRTINLNIYKNMSSKFGSPYYENIEFSVGDGTTNYDLDTQQATFLSSFNDDDHNLKGEFPTYMSFRTNQTVSIKLNSTSSHAITVASTDSPFVIDGVEIRNVYITNNSGNAAAIKIYFQFSPNS
jgi:hypothetical protein